MRPRILLVLGISSSGLFPTVLKVVQVAGDKPIKKRFVVFFHTNETKIRACRSVWHLFLKIPLRQRAPLIGWEGQMGGRFAMGVFVLGPAGHCTQPPPDFDSFCLLIGRLLGLNRVNIDGWGWCRGG